MFVGCCYFSFINLIKLAANFPQHNNNKIKYKQNAINNKKNFHLQLYCVLEEVLQPNNHKAITYKTEINQKQNNKKKNSL